MNEHQAWAHVRESCRSGAARIIDEGIVLEREQLIKLVDRCISTGRQDAWDQLMRAMAGFVFQKAHGYYLGWSPRLPAHASFDDVFLAGLEGVHIAATKFDASRGMAFTTPAGHWVRQRIQRAIYPQVGICRIPEEDLLEGVDRSSPMLAGGARSLDSRARVGGVGMQFHEMVQAQPVVSSMIEDTALVTDIVAVLRLVDEKLPHIIGLIDRSYSYHEIARIVGMPWKRVRDLHEAAGAAVLKSGVASDYL